MQKTNPRKIIPMPRKVTDDFRELHEQMSPLTPISWDELSRPSDLSDTLLENRFLERGQGLILFGPAGLGKSAANFQMCGCWSAGLSGIHLKPPRPLRIVILQTEDSTNDLREYHDGVFSQPFFTAEKINLAKQNFIVLPPVPGGSPEDLQQLLDDTAARHKPDLISLNPLLAFCAADYTRELGALLYQVIDPIIKKHHIGFTGVHHTTKPIYKDTSGYGAYDYQYLAAGDARIANWPRASIQIEPIALNPVLTACFRITKRWQRVSWANEHGEPTRERYLKHSEKIWWADASQEEVASAQLDEDPRKILDILPGPSEPGIIREEVRVRAKNKLHIGKDKADGWLKIVLQDGLARRREKTKRKRKIALFRRAYE
jgi:AAA domain